MTSLVSASQVITGQVQSLDSLRAHSLPSDAMIVASSTLVTPTNQNPGSYAIVESSGGSSFVVNGSVPATTLSPFADLYKEGSVYFPGVNTSNITYNSTSSFNFASGLTAEAWVNYQTFAGSTVTILAQTVPCLVGAFTPTNTVNTGWAFGVNTSGQVCLYYYAGAAYALASTQALTTNTWNHVAMSITSGGAINLYINGTSVASGTVQGGGTSTAGYLGAGSLGTAYTTGYVADIRVVSGAALYTGSTFTVPSAPLGNPSSGVQQMLIRAGQNSPTIQNGALTFDRGLKQFMNFGPQTFNIATRGFTAVFRYQFNGTATNYERIFQASLSKADQNNSLSITRLGTGGQLTFQWVLASAYATAVNSASGLAQGTTYVAALVYNPSVGSGTAQWWINGAPSGTAITGLSSAITSDLLTPFTFMGVDYLGGPSTAVAQCGNFSSNTLAIYNRALSNVEILNAYSALTTTPATPLQKTLEIGDINGVPALSVAGNGQVSVQSIGLSSNVVPWPPAAMTGYDTVINGGVYKARASTEYPGQPPWYAFEKGGSQWSTNGSLYSASTFLYTGTSTTTDVNGTVYPGEWLQIQIPSPVTVSSYSITPTGSGGVAISSPVNFVVLGSRDGVNWFSVNSQAGITSWSSSTPQTFTVASGQAYTYYRIVINKLNGNNQNAVILELTLYGTADTSPTLTIAPATTFATSVATPSLTGVAGSAFVPQDFSSSGLNIPAYVVSNTATTANTVAYSSFGPFAGEGSLYFPGGTGQYVNFGQPAQLAYNWTSYDFTIECFVYPLTTAVNQNIFVRDFEQVMFINSGDSKLYYYMAGSTPGNFVGPVIARNQWSHLAVSWSQSAQTMYISVNGSVISAAITSGTPTYAGTRNFVMGSWSGTNGYLNMNVANLRFTRGLALYTTTFTPPTGPLQPIQGTTQAGLPYGTVLLLRNAPAPGRIQTTKFSGANSVGVLSFPPAAMTTYATALSSGYGQGTYVASASSEFPTPAAGYPYAWYAFDKTTTNYFVSNAPLYGSSSPYAYTGTVTTVDITGTSYAGEWLQIQKPVSTIISSYIITCNGISAAPQRFVVLGSRDGVNWFLVDSRSGVTWTTTGQSLTFSTQVSQSYIYYRIVTMNLQGNGTYVQMQELVFNGTIESVNISADGRVGLGVVNPVQALEVAGDVVCAGTLSAGNPLMFRNRIINGDFRIDQRNAGASFTLTTPAALTYTLDRWWGWCRLASKFSVQQTSVVPLGLGFKNSVRVTSLSAYTTVASDYYGFGQYIEGYNIADLNWGTSYGTPVTLSFWVRASIAGNYSLALEGASFLPSYIIQYTVSAVDTWQQIVSTVQPPTNGYTANFPSTTAASLRLWWDLGSSDATYGGAAGVWIAADKLRVTGSVSLVATNAATLYIAGVQVEKGTVATPFEVRPFAIELALCQRYYYRLTAGASNQNISTGIGISSSNVHRFQITTPVLMRTSNPMTIFTPSGSASFPSSSLALTSSELYIYNGGSAYVITLLSAGDWSSTNTQIISFEAKTQAASTATPGLGQLFFLNYSGSYLALSAEL